MNSKRFPKQENADQDKRSSEDFDDSIFQADVFISNTNSNELAVIMQDLLDNLSDHEFKKYFTVSVGKALDQYEDQLNEIRLASLGSNDVKIKELPIQIVKC